MKEDRYDIRFEIRMSKRQHAMLVQLAQIQRRSMNDAVRLAIERVYQAETLRIADAAGRAQAVGRAIGRS